MVNLFDDYAPVVGNIDFGNNATTPYFLNLTIESLTRDVYVKPLHSHNDYWRKHPLFDALSVGAVSIESDVWHFDNDYTLERTNTETTTNVTNLFSSDEIYVGHNQVFLDPARTLNHLYLNPIFNFLQEANPQFQYVDSSIAGSPLLEENEGKHGIFYNSPESPVYLWFDIKTEANSTYDALKPLIQRFIDNDFLAYYDADQQEYVPGPLVLTITGNLPQERVEAESKRYLFLDAPLKLYVNETNEAELSKWQQLSVVASSSLTDLLGVQYQSSTKNEFSDQQKQALQTILDKAHYYNLTTRIWGDITWPYSLVNSHLRDYFELGSDLINVDNLQLARDVL